MSEKVIAKERVMTREQLLAEVSRLNERLEKVAEERDNYRDALDEQIKESHGREQLLAEHVKEHAKERERLQEQLRALVDLVGAKERHLRSVRAWFVNTIDVLLNTQRETTRNLIMSAAGEALIPNEQAKGK